MDIVAALNLARPISQSRNQKSQANSSSGSSYDDSTVLATVKAIQDVGYAGYPPAADIQGLSPIFSTRAVPLAATNNVLTLKDGTYQMGTFGGKQVAIRFFGGKVETSLHPMISLPTSAKVSLADQIAARVMRSVSRDAFLAADAQTGFLAGLYRLGNGKQSLELFNRYITAPNPNTGQVFDLKQGLAGLGIDTNKPFSLNGITYVLQGNSLAAK